MDKTNGARALRDAPYHAESLWGLVRAHPDGQTEMCYRLGVSANDLWKAVVAEEGLGTGHTKKSLKRHGWCARPFFVEEVSRP